MSDSTPQISKEELIKAMKKYGAQLASQPQEKPEREVGNGELESKDNISKQTIEALKKKTLGEDKKRKELAAKFRDVLEKTKKKAQPFKKEIVTKFKKNIIGVLVLPPRDLEKEEKKDLDLLVILDIKEKDELKDKMKKKFEIEKQILKIGNKKLPGGATKKVYDKEEAREVEVKRVNCILLEEIWDMCHKGKYDILNLITIGAPVYDTGWVATLRGLEIHKMQVLRKFEKYVVAYITAGSLIRGDAKAGSDVDVYIVIDDTDVTRMTSGELQSKLLGIISGMAWEAKDIAGTKVVIHPQVWILSDMWNSLRNANPVIFSVIRQGVPLYDRGMFTPWKLLLTQGKITPSPEAVENYMKSGKQFIDRIKRKFKDIAMDDFFWATITPAQGALMLINIPPPDPKATVELFREHFVKKGYIEEKYAKILEDNLKIRKDIEHGKLKEVSGEIVAKHLKKSEEFLKRIDKLFKKIEGEQLKKEAKELYDKAVDDALAALAMFGVQAEEKEILKVLKDKLVDRKLAPLRYYNLLQKIFDIYKDPTNISRQELANLLFEENSLSLDVFNLIRAEKGKRIEKYKISCHYANGKKTAGIWLFTDEAYIIKDSSQPNTPIKKFKISKDGELIKAQSATLKEIEKKLTSFAGTPTTMTNKTIESLKKILADDIKVVIGA